LYLCQVCALLLSVLFPYTTLFRSALRVIQLDGGMMFQQINQFRRDWIGLGLLLPRGINLAMTVGNVSNLGEMRRPLALGIEIQRSEEHTSELQSRFDLVCRLLLEK